MLFLISSTKQSDSEARQPRSLRQGRAESPRFVGSKLVADLRGARTSSTMTMLARTARVAVVVVTAALLLLLQPCTGSAGTPAPASAVSCVHDQKGEQVSGLCVEADECDVVSFLAAQDDEAPRCEDVLNADGESLVCCPRHVRTDYFENDCIRYLFKESLSQATRVNGPGAESIARKKCREYANVYCYKQNAFPMISVVGQCALTTPYVKGGENAKLEDVPSMALLGYGGDSAATSTCGGTLISERFVLTAAHCVSGLDVAWVKLGLVCQSNPGPTARTYGVERVFVHEGYRGAEGRVMYNDIALVKLNASVDLAPQALEVRPACLHTDLDRPPEVGREATIAGWGLNSDSGGVLDQLQHANLPFVSQEECKEDYRKMLDDQLPAGIADTQLCSGKITDRDAGQGDSGGPLLLQADDVYCSKRVVGVISLGMSRPGGGVVTIFTRVASFVPWIESIVWPSA